MYSISSRVLQDEVAGLARVDQIRHDPALLVQLDVGLRDDPLVFFPRREVLAVGFVLGRLLLGADLRLVFSISPRGTMSPDLEIGVAGVQDLDFVDHVRP